MKFIKPYDEVIAPVTDPGNEYEPIYEEAFDEKGHITLREVRKENLVARIRSFKDSCSIESLIKRYIASGGDSSILQQRSGIFADMTSVPSSMPEMYDLVHRGKQFFESLPDEYKKVYNYNPAEFMFDEGKKLRAMFVPAESEVKSDVTDAQ